ncbi:hypothetical protein D3C79_760230 [compost metagenome]
MVAEQRGDGFATAFERDVAHLVRIDADLARQQGGFHPVLAADRGTCTEYHAVGIFLEGVHQVFEGFVRRVGAHGDHAVIGADGGQPFHVIDVVPAELALRKVKQRAAGEGDHGAEFRRALSDDGVIGHRADAAWHIGDAHRFVDGLGFLQRYLDQLAGQIKPAAGLGGGDAFGAFRRFYGKCLIGRQQQGGCGQSTGDYFFHCFPQGVFLSE